MPPFAAPTYSEFYPNPPVLGWLTKRDFDRARLTGRGFTLWSRYSDFVAERDALRIGYGAAGVTAAMQKVDFAGFERWARLTGAPLDLDGLDEFAAHRLWRTQNSGAPVVGRFGVPDHPERNAISAAGVQYIRVRPELFVRWRDDIAKSGLLAAPDLDAYAAHVVEFCLLSSKLARRPALNSP